MTKCLLPVARLFVAPPIHVRIALSVLVVAYGLVVASIANADEHQNWDLALGTGVAYAPDYGGASTASARLRIWADGAYRTEAFGTLALDSGSLTIAPEARWDFLDSPDNGLGVLVGYRAGRTDRNPGFTSADDGSTRLQGLPSVSGTIDAGVAGHVAVLGVPLFAQVRTALNPAQGTLLSLGAYLPLNPGQGFELTILPTVTWDNLRQMRAQYGVTPAAATASGFAPYEPGAGWENAAIEIVGDWRVSGRWHFVASIAYQRLLGNAAHSPIVQTSNQASALAGVTLDF